MNTRALIRALIVAALGLSCGAGEVRVLEDGSPAKLTGLGNEALIQGRHETAIQHYRQALARDPRYVHALFNLGLAHQQLDQLDEARRWYDEALKVEPENAQVLCNLGWLAHAAGDYAVAVARFEEAARLTSHQPREAAEHWFNAGAARSDARQHGEARRAYEEALALDPDHYGARYNLGTLYLGALATAPKALDHARAHLTRATELHRDRCDAWLNLALCLERAHEDPLPAFDQAVVCAAVADAPRARWQRALYFDRCQPPKRTAMRDDLVAVLAQAPDFPEANGKLGAYEMAIGDYDRAVEHLRREVAAGNFDPHARIDQEAHYLLAVAYAEHRPDPAKALEHATAYYQLHPDSAKIHELRRRVLGSAGRPRTTVSEQPHLVPAVHIAPAASQAPPAPAHGHDDHGHGAPTAHDAHGH